MELGQEGKVRIDLSLYAFHAQHSYPGACRWNSNEKKMEYPTSPRGGSGASAASRLSAAPDTKLASSLNELRTSAHDDLKRSFCRPQLTKKPLTCALVTLFCTVINSLSVLVFTDLRKLIETNEGRALSDAKLVGEDGGESIKVHRCVLLSQWSVLIWRWH